MREKISVSVFHMLGLRRYGNMYACSVNTKCWVHQMLYAAHGPMWHVPPSSSMRCDWAYTSSTRNPAHARQGGDMNRAELISLFLSHVSLSGNACARTHKRTSSGAACAESTWFLPTDVPEAARVCISGVVAEVWVGFCERPGQRGRRNSPV